jgi:hypothetical protein
MISRRDAPLILAEHTIRIADELALRCLEDSLPQPRDFVR